MLKKGLYIFLIVLVLTTGFIWGYFSGSNKYIKFLNEISLVRENNNNYPLVHPIIGFNTANALSINDFAPLTKKIRDIFSSNKEYISRYSVYFRDFKKGFWVGLNENDTYDPASMLKVVLAMAVYKQAENDPIFLKKKLTFTSELALVNSDVSFTAPSELKVNQAYAVEDLLKKMIVDSDNGAKDVLANNVDQKILHDIYVNLDIDIPNDNVAYVISAKKYTLFFRMLYGGTYLNEDFSNRLLTLLSKTTFTEGLTKGIPNDIAVAHKFGEHVNTSDNRIDAIELHDCGIIYHPNNPYLLCVMTQGKDESDLAQVIAEVSKTVYEEVNSGFK